MLKKSRNEPNSDENKSTGAEMNNAAGRPYGELIREYRRRKGLSQAELGQLAHVKQNAVGAWEAGRSRPDLACIPALCRELSLPMAVFFGLEQENPSYDEVISRYGLLNEYNRQVILKQMDALYELQTQMEPASPRRLVGVYQSDLSAAAGFSYGIGEGSGEMIYLIADPVTEAADEIIHVSGDSMEPTYYDGDQILIQHCDSVREGQIGIFVNGDAGYIKEYRSDGLYSHNPRYPVMRFSEDEPVRCIGKVLGLLKKTQLARPEEIAEWKGSQAVLRR